MGFNGCWIAVKDKNVADLAKAIGFEVVADSTVTHPIEVRHSAGELRSWGLVVLTDFEERLLNEDLLRKLSTDARVVSCLISESAMFASSEFWASGQRVWRIVHDSQTGDLSHLRIEGERLPKSLESHRLKAIAAQTVDAEVDHMFDVPLYAAREMTGFKHDDEPPKDARFCEVSLPPARATKPWWKFW